MLSRPHRIFPLYLLAFTVATVPGLRFVASGQPAAQPALPTPQELAEIFGEGQKEWQLPTPSNAAGYRIVDDTPNRRRVLANTTTRPLSLRTEKDYGPGIEIRARFQLAAEAGKTATFTLSTANAGPRDAGFSVIVTAANNDTQNATVRITPARPGFGSHRFQVKAYPTVNPAWDPVVRASVEHDMAKLPDVNQRWFYLRVQLGEQNVRFFLDDRMLEERPWEQVRREGWISTTLSAGTRLAELRIAPFAATGQFEPVPLNQYLNARAIANGQPVNATSLPAPGQEIKVAGIPFVLPQRGADGNDHIDVGVSNLRQANMEGYLPSRINRFAGSLQLDPARLQFRVPNDRYDALYVIAASDNDKDNIPLLSASFFKPDAGFVRFFEATVPAVSEARSTQATPVPVQLANGQNRNLWLVKMPLEPGQLSDFSNLPALEFELSKKIHLYRSYPDPINYGWHPGGLPSGVHVYAITLHRPEVHFTITPKNFGHVWSSNETPEYSASLENRSNTPRRVSLLVTARSYDGDENHRVTKDVTVPAGKTVEENIVLPVKKFGYHDVTAAMSYDGRNWTETRSLVKLAPDTRAAKWEEGKGPLFGTFSYFGGHEQPDAVQQLRLLGLAGAKTPHRSPRGAEEARVMEQFGMVHHKAFGREHWTTMDWVRSGYKADDPEGSMQRLIEMLKKEELPKSTTVELDYMTFFPEPHLSRDLTAGNLPDYFGDPPYQMNAAEQERFKLYYDALLVGSKAVRKQWPNLDILIPWGDPMFVAPFLRAGFPKELIDGSGIDIPTFERLPEQQLHQSSLHRLYMLREEYRKAGIPNPKMHFVEGPFVPTEPGAVSWREQMDLYARSTHICMGYGMDRFYAGWGVFIDAASYYGSEHYGGNGIFTRLPHVMPKPAYAAFATTTLMLDRTKFDKWLPTGSHSAYAIRYTHTDGRSPVYALWTVRGKRPITLRFNGPARATLTDMMGNPAPMKIEGQTATFTIDTTPVWLIDAGGDFTVGLGEPNHADAQPPRDAKKLANLGDGTWRFTDERDSIYENNNFDTKRFSGPISAAATNDTARGKALAVKLGEPEKERKLMPFYRVLRPAAPLTIPGKSSHLGLWVKGNSDWGRVIYSLRDAKGERWVSIGTKDQWNCDDMHSWSYFNFDGWRYLRFEMPSNLPYDSFKEASTTWWGHYGGDGTVDLPLQLENLIVERRTHLLYFNDIQAANRADVLLGDLLVEYSEPADATPEAVRLASLRMAAPQGTFELPNPIARLAETGVGAPTTITGIRNPDVAYDGTRIHVNFNPVEGAQSYDVWLSAYPDGRGAIIQGKAWTQPGQLLTGLRPARDLYLFVTYTDKDGTISKPSAPFKINLVDEFGMK